MIKFICDGCECEFDQSEFVAVIQITSKVSPTLDGFRPGHAPQQMQQRTIHYCKDCMDLAMQTVDKENK